MVGCGRLWWVVVGCGGLWWVCVVVYGDMARLVTEEVWFVVWLSLFLLVELFHCAKKV